MEYDLDPGSIEKIPGWCMKKSVTYKLLSPGLINPYFSYTPEHYRIYPVGLGNGGVVYFENF